jgi:5'-deoxynucleotidase YfbR-like HD superfamily hydrolase
MSMNRLVRLIEKLRGLNFVRRWNFHPHLRDENVAEHSFWVAIITAAIAPERPQLVLVALMHDAEEAITADCPALVKGHVAGWDRVVDKAEEELFSGSLPVGDDPAVCALWDARRAEAVVKFADQVAALLYTKEEIGMGNAQFERIQRELIASAWKSIAKLHGDHVNRAARMLSELGFVPSQGVERPAEMSHL